MPSKTAMQSGMARSKSWVLEFVAAEARSVDPLMGWTSSDDTQSQVKLRFETRDAALDYCEEHGIEVTVSEARSRKRNIRKGGYGENFATDRRGSWTH
jgi:NADH dehydrogenase